MSKQLDPFVPTVGAAKSGYNVYGKGQDLVKGTGKQAGVVDLYNYFVKGEKKRAVAEEPNRLKHVYQKVRKPPPEKKSKPAKKKTSKKKK